jgi:hypothetical protein
VTRASFEIETKPLILPHTSIEPINFRTFCKKAKMRSGQTMKRTNSFSRPTQMKIALFRSLFSGLPNAYGIRDPKTERQFQVKRPVTNQALFNHLTGKEHYGVYLLNGARTKAAVADFDDSDALPVIEFFNTASHYGLPVCIEVSKSKGFHGWIFFETIAVAASKARLVVKHMLKEIGEPDVEVFPKQDHLDSNVTSGNFILSPLFGELVVEGKTVFIDPMTLSPYPNQWKFLSEINRVPESVLDDIIELNELKTRSSGQVQKIESSTGSHINVFGIPPCAQRMLREGVTRYQRVSCFRLAVHLKRIGLLCDMAQAVLKLWAQRNRPADQKRLITEQEILEQTVYAYSKPYRGYGCGSEAVLPYCDHSCRVLRNRHP